MLKKNIIIKQDTAYMPRVGLLFFLPCIDTDYQDLVHQEVLAMINNNIMNPALLKLIYIEGLPPW